MSAESVPTGEDEPSISGIPVRVSTYRIAPEDRPENLLDAERSKADIPSAWRNHRHTLPPTGGFSGELTLGCQRRGGAIGPLPVQIRPQRFAAKSYRAGADPPAATGPFLLASRSFALVPRFWLYENDSHL